MSESATATIVANQLATDSWSYSITLNDTGSTTLGTFWFSWVPGKDFMDVSPTSVSDPTGWTDVITNAGGSDGFAIQWHVVSTASGEVSAGNSLSGFSFTSSEAPSQLFGNSSFFPGTSELTSFVYSGEPFSDGGFQFTVTAVCFLAGTLIATNCGEVAVEHLKVGDQVRTISGEFRPVHWIGTGKVLATRGRRTAATPVIVRKGALADNMPCRDLRVTKGHALYIDGALIPVEELINHRSINWDDRAQEVTVYHIELDTHDVLIADGAAAESYRDDGNRWLFRNAAPSWRLPPQAPCAPLLTSGPMVDAIWQRLLDRTGRRSGSPLTEDPDLHLLVDGRRLEASERHGNAYAFRLTTRPGQVRIRSRCAIPQELGTARDPRMLGVAVQRIVLTQTRQQRAIHADAVELIDGYHSYEPNNGIRWTDGDAAVPAKLFAGISGPAMLIVQLGTPMRYIEDGSLSNVA